MPSASLGIDSIPTIADAYLRPGVGTYLEGMGERLDAFGPERPAEVTYTSEATFPVPVMPVLLALSE